LFLASFWLSGILYVVALFAMLFAITPRAIESIHYFILIVLIQTIISVLDFMRQKPALKKYNFKDIKFDGQDILINGIPVADYKYEYLILDDVIQAKVRVFRLEYGSEFCYALDRLRLRYVLTMGLAYSYGKGKYELLPRRTSYVP